MDFGLLIFATDYAIAPDTLAREAEAHGFESCFYPNIRTYPPAGNHPGRVVQNSRVSTGMRTILLLRFLWPRQ